MTANMTASTFNTPFLDFLRPYSAIPVPTAVTKSYSGPDLMTALPTEVFQGIASFLDADSIKALRLTNKAAAVRSKFNLRACRHSLNVKMTKVGIRRGLHNLQWKCVNASVKEVTFKTYITGRGMLRNGARPNARRNIPIDGDVKALLDHIPNVTTIMLRGYARPGIPEIICNALTAAPRAKLTYLVIDGCDLKFQVLKNLLNAHRQTLRQLILRDILLTDSPFTYSFLNTLKTDFGLTLVVLEKIYGPSGQLFQVLHPRHFQAWSGIYRQAFWQIPYQGLQHFYLGDHFASFTGEAAVQQGFQKILWTEGQ